MHEGFYWDGEKKKGTRVCVGEREREREMNLIRTDIEI